MSSMHARPVLLRFELADALRSRWVVFVALAYLLVFGAFVWLGLRESSVLGFTGLSRVVLNVSNAIVVVLPLVALVSSHQSIVRSRTTGLFELVLVQPCRRVDWLFAAALSRLVVIVGPLALAFIALLIAGVWNGEQALGPLVLRSLVVVAALSFAFVGIGFFLSSIAKTSERATVYALVAWLGATVLHDFALIGVLLRWHVAPAIVFGLAAANPVEAARLAILSGADPDLSVFGPVGFWLANTLGPRLTFAVGVGWPLVIGAASFALARRNFERTDLVG